jgi:hypothetical protein
MTLDELLLEWSYRSEKGYPSMGSPSDLSILKEILTQLNLNEEDVSSIIDELEDDPEDLDTPGTDGMEDSDVEDEKEKQTQVKPKSEPESELEPQEKPQEEPQNTTVGSESYDNVIRRHLGLDENQPIPRSKNSYPFPGAGGATFDIQVKSDDMKYWKDFWGLTPPKEGETEGGTKGVGNGEISLYWLYNHSDSNINVNDTRGADNPDLRFNNVGVEVKAYPKHQGKHGLGRFGQDVEQLKMLGVIFGINALAKQFQPKPEGKKRAPKDVNPLTWDGNNLTSALDEVMQFKKVDIDQLADVYDIFNQIKQNLDFLDKRLGDYTTSSEGARKMALEFIKPKVARKPGDGGFLTNVLINGDCRFWQIDYDKVLNNKDALNHIKAAQGSMQVNFEELFGK